jgi:hypothetical protein
MVDSYGNHALLYVAPESGATGNEHAELGILPSDNGLLSDRGLRRHRLRLARPVSAIERVILTAAGVSAFATLAFIAGLAFLIW